MSDDPMQRLSARLALLLLPLALVACTQEEWLTDMKQQPSVGTWQVATMDSTGEAIPSRGQPQGSVPVTGVTVASWQVSYTPSIAAVESLTPVPNPVAADERSLANGQKHYQINCAVCHGEIGDANGTLKQLNPAYGFAPSLLAASAVGRSDGYLWGMMRNGRGLMASANRIPERERWDVVNYLRGLQGRYPVRTGPVGFPGQTGTALPGYSAIGPTVPSAYNRPSTAGITPKAPKAEAPKTEGAKTTGGHE